MGEVGETGRVEEVGVGGGGVKGLGATPGSTLRVQVPNNHILPQNLYLSYFCPNPKYLNIGYLDP